MNRPPKRHAAFATTVLLSLAFCAGMTGCCYGGWYAVFDPLLPEKDHGPVTSIEDTLPFAVDPVRLQTFKRTTLVFVEVRSPANEGTLKIHPESFELDILRTQFLLFRSLHPFRVTEENLPPQMVLVAVESEDGAIDIIWKDFDVELDHHPPWNPEFRDSRMYAYTRTLDRPEDLPKSYELTPGSTVRLYAYFVANYISRAAFEFDIEDAENGETYRYRVMFSRWAR